MGAWGYKALESDEGLDMLAEFTNLVRINGISDIGTIIERFVKLGLLSRESEEDFLYDHVAMGLAELIADFASQGKLELFYLDSGKNEQHYILDNLTWGKEDLQFLVSFLEHILDPENEHETYELWEDSDSFEEWKVHNLDLIAKLKALMAAE